MASALTRKDMLLRSVPWVILITLLDAPGCTVRSPVELADGAGRQDGGVPVSLRDGAAREGDSLLNRDSRLASGENGPVQDSGVCGGFTSTNSACIACIAMACCAAAAACYEVETCRRFIGCTMECRAGRQDCDACKLSYPVGAPLGLAFLDCVAASSVCAPQCTWSSWPLACPCSCGGETYTHSCADPLLTPGGACPPTVCGQGLDLEAKVTGLPATPAGSAFNFSISRFSTNTVTVLGATGVQNGQATVTSQGTLVPGEVHRLSYYIDLDADTKCTTADVAGQLTVPAASASPVKVSAAHVQDAAACAFFP